MTDTDKLERLIIAINKLDYILDNYDFLWDSFPNEFQEAWNVVRCVIDDTEEVKWQQQ